MFQLTSSEKKLFLFNLLIFFLNGLAFGVFMNSDVIARRVLGASTFTVTFMLFLTNGVLITSLPMVSLMGRGRRRLKFLIRAAMVCSIPVMMLYFHESIAFFVFAVFLVYILNTILPPALNLLFKRNYRREVTGKLYGVATSLRMIATMTGALITGKLLDISEAYHIPLFAAAGFMTMGSVIITAFLNYGETEEEKADNSHVSIRQSLKNMNRIIAEDRVFYRFERNYIIYGLAFLLLLPVIPVYFVDALKLDYTTISTSRQVVGLAGLMLLSPIAGYIFDRYNTFHFTGLMFLILTMYPLFLGISGFVPGDLKVYMVYAGYAIYSIAMTGIQISWNIGTIRLATLADSDIYQGIHITLTGLRSLFGPLLGFLLMKFFGYQAAFATAFGLFLTAGILMLREKEGS
ncbi:MFS transporter [Myxococcota bacterium]|nr:MFS transporter [Myxococcota bacterium]MBU1380939.1 MFS transporter [Myxococcota bacterium]MBU1495748.1 MFS transporter [Myxococcota bacterium]